MHLLRPFLPLRYADVFIRAAAPELVEVQISSLILINSNNGGGGVRDDNSV
jgi:hypothetical protein